MNTKANRTRQFHIRLNEEERTRMHERAKKAGYGLSEFVRECGLNGMVQGLFAGAY